MFVITMLINLQRSPTISATKPRSSEIVVDYASPSFCGRSRKIVVDLPVAAVLRLRRVRYVRAHDIICKACLLLTTHVIFRPKANMNRQKRTWPKILQLLVGSQDGGADTFFAKLCVALHHEGVPQKIIISPHLSREETFQQNGCDFDVINFDGYAGVFANRKFKRILAAYKPNIVVAWMNRAARRVPPGPYSRVARLGGHYPIRWYQDFDFLIANTPHIRRKLVSANYPENQTTVISNFGNMDNSSTLTKGDLGLAENLPLLLCLGRLDRTKGFDIAIKALSHIPSANLVIAGSGSEGLRLKELAGEMGLANRIKFLEWVPNAACLIRAADACLVPSRREPLSNVVLECWFAGTPVVAARVEGPSWLIRSGVDGLLVTPNDAIALADAAKAVLNSSELRRSLIANGLVRHQNEFSRRIITQQYIALLERLSAEYHAKERFGPKRLNLDERATAYSASC